MLKIIQLSDNGYPDLYCHKEGRTVWFEVKAPGGAEKDGEPLQEVRRHQLQAVGMEAYEVDSLDDVKRIIS